MTYTVLGGALKPTHSLTSLTPVILLSDNECYQIMNLGKLLIHLYFCPQEA